MLQRSPVQAECGFRISDLGLRITDLGCRTPAPLLVGTTTGRRPRRRMSRRARSNNDKETRRQGDKERIHPAPCLPIPLSPCLRSGWVTVTGPPCSIWRSKVGTTLPREPRTSPKRTVEKEGLALQRPDNRVSWAITSSSSFSSVAIRSRRRTCSSRASASSRCSLVLSQRALRKAISGGRLRRR